MVAYQPPDQVVLAIGAAFRAEPLSSAAGRILRLAQQDLTHLEPFGIDEDEVLSFRRMTNLLKGMLGDKRLLKNDTPVQMTEVPETMAKMRSWLNTLRLLASINLALDAPALERISSSAPEMAEGYPRDMLAEFRKRLSAASDLKPRLEEVGLTDAFLGRGRRLAAQLQTAIGKEDIDGDNLSLPQRRFYAQKGQVYVAVKRIARAGRLAFILIPQRARQYHLDEIEPVLVEPPPKAVKPRPKA